MKIKVDFPTDTIAVFCFISSLLKAEQNYKYTEEAICSQKLQCTERSVDLLNAKACNFISSKYSHLNIYCHKHKDLCEINVNIVFEKN